VKIFITAPAPKMLPGLVYVLPPQQPIFIDIAQITRKIIQNRINQEIFET